MQEKNFGFYKYNVDTIRNIWTESIIVIDTNILLNSYKMSPEGRINFLTFLKKLKIVFGYQTRLEKNFIVIEKLLLMNNLELLKKQRMKVLKYLMHY